MRSCCVVTCFSLDQPGFLDFAYRIRALATRYQVTVIGAHGPNVPELQIDGVTHVALADGDEACSVRRYLWRAALYLRKARPDFVILLHTLAAPLVHALRATPCALYWNEHAIRFKASSPCSPIKRILRELKYEWSFISAMRKADLVMPIGEAHRDDLLAHGCRPERVKMIYMGVDKVFSGVALQRIGPDDDGPLDVVYTGSVNKDRGRDVMLEAVAKARSLGVPVRLVIVGALESERQICQVYARELDIETNVVVHGRLPGSEIPRFIAGADAGICIWEDRPWTRFNPPTKLFEYLVAGLPVLASNIRTHTDYVSHGMNGLIFDYDGDSLAGAFGELWRRRKDLSAMRRRAWESGRRYLWSTIEPVFLEAVASMVRGKAAKR